MDVWFLQPKIFQIFKLKSQLQLNIGTKQHHADDIADFFTVLGYKFLFVFHPSFPAQFLKHVSVLNTNPAVILDVRCSPCN